MDIYVLTLSEVDHFLSADVKQVYITENDPHNKIGETGKIV